MIELTALQLVALSSLAFLGLMRLLSWLFGNLQTFMAPHVHIAALVEERANMRSLLRVAQAYVPTTTSEGAEFHDTIAAILDDGITQ